MNLRKLAVCLMVAALSASAQNLLLNPSYEFHSFENHRNGNANNYRHGTAAFWSAEAYGDLEACREAHIDPSQRPAYSVGNIATVKPGKSFWQMIPLSEARLAHGDKLSFSVAGWQSEADAASVSVELLKIDSEDGTWSPADFGFSDKRSFPKHSRGEMVVAKAYTASAQAKGAFELALADLLLDGHFTVGEDSHSADMNTIAVRVKFTNVSKNAVVHFWAPALVRGSQAPAPAAGLTPALRPMMPVFANLPKTMQKLWKGQSIHILLMGSSIDRGSANPPMYLYDENPASPTFKQPLSEQTFEADKIGHPEYDGYFGWWQHYHAFAGRLRLELMRKFNLPISKICLNYMATDGSCVAEATSGLESYCTLNMPCAPAVNGHKKDCDWKALYPELFTRSQGPAPDLVIFGSGANEKTDTPDEGAIFEATIRWIQQRYPDTEFLFCQFQNRGGYTPNPGDLMALALRYQIPFMDYGKLGDDITRWCNPRALVPRDGHPQAAAHALWAYELEKAFECWDPIPAGKAQLHLPSRLYETTVGWEGQLKTYQKDDPRLKDQKAVILDDTTVNLWADNKQDGVAYIDGTKINVRVRPSWGRDSRNSSFRWGRLALGDRHILELEQQPDKPCLFQAVDMKTVNSRQFYPVNSAFWTGVTATSPFQSQWGAPYGTQMATLKAGETAEIMVPATDVSIAYVDAPDAGTLLVKIDGKDALSVAANVPFTLLDGTKIYMENRKGIRYLPYGMHRVTVTADGAPVSLLGIFTYDTRPNLSSQRVVHGVAVADEPVQFIPPFKALPIIHAYGDVKVKELTHSSVIFSGARGTFTAVGE